MSRKRTSNTKKQLAETLVLDGAPFLLYVGDNEKVHIHVLLHAETIWLTQRQMAELFHTTSDNISLHLKNIYLEAELNEESTTEDFSAVQKEGERNVRRMIKHYNLDAIIAVGYRVNSRRATQFRMWATSVLREFIKKGFALDDERLAQGERVFGKDYLRELLERVRSIRTSERRIWQQVTDIFAECSIDYNPKSEITQNFFASVQKQIPFCYYRANRCGNYTF